MAALLPQRGNSRLKILGDSYFHSTVNVWHILNSSFYEG
jgi:hypothetical protein